MPLAEGLQLQFAWFDQSNMKMGGLYYASDSL